LAVKSYHELTELSMLPCRSGLLMEAEIVKTMTFYDTDCGGVVSNFP